MKITAELLQSAVGCTAERAARFAPWIDAACAHFKIDSQARLAAFLAQIGHESGSFAWVREIADGSAYEGRANLGNTQPGDGPRYKGRGLIQVTGRDGYRKTTLRLMDLGAPDFEDRPEMLEEPRWAAWSAADWWDAHGCNGLADVGEYIAISRLINRGNAASTKPANGEADRIARWERTKAALATNVAPVPEEPAVADPVEPLPHYQTEWDMQNPQPEKPVLPIVGSLVYGLAQSLFTAFTPLAQEKLTKELGRHTKNPEVAQQVAQAAISAVQAATGKADPIEAVMEAKANPAVVATAEASVMEELERMAPLMERMAKLDNEQFALEEASRATAGARPRPQDRFLTHSIIWMVVGLMTVLALLMGGLAYLKVSETVLMAAFGLFNAVAMLVISKFGSRYDFDYGSSASSANKDAVRDAALLGRK